MFQAAYSDGHSAIVHMAGHDQPEAQLGVYPDWNGTTTDHLFWRCVILRGPGWQIDTLPAPPVPTTIPCSGSGAVVNPVG